MEGREYRVTVEGFKVDSQAPDLVSSMGDRGDNVYVSVDTIWADPAGKPQVMKFSHRSLIYGDLFTTMRGGMNPQPLSELPQPILYAGMNGKGLKNGEEIPYQSPWIRKAELTRDKLPMLLIDKKFTTHSGEGFILSIWTWHHLTRDDLHEAWQSNIQNCCLHSRKIFDVFDQLRTQDRGRQSSTNFIMKSSALGVQPLKINCTDWFKLPKIRPIGIMQSEGSFAFDAPVIVLNSISAKICASLDRGFGKGVIPIEFTDTPQSAKYRLFLKVEAI